MTTCARCGRALRKPVLLGGNPFGRVCAAAMGTAQKPKRVRIFEIRAPRAQEVDSRQADLFAEVRP